jgi:glyoxylase-like metal-dependent hydrolase (beta-lactamase superfamily II)
MADANELMLRNIVVGVFQENCYIVGSRRTREAICIDPGDEPAEILALARDMGVEIKLIANSHAHVDHILAVGEVKASTDANFLLHPEDVELARHAPESASRFLGYLPAAPPEPDGLLADGDTVEVDGLRLTVLHTPGHTQGSVCYYSEGMLFSGDTLFRGSIGRTDLPGGSGEQEIRSIVDRLLLLPDETIVLPGHMLETTIRAEREQNPFVRRELRRRAAGRPTA